MEGYCVSCKAQREMKDAKQELTKNGRQMLKGSCHTCGTKMCKFVAGSASASSSSSKKSGKGSK